MSNKGQRALKNVKAEIVTATEHYMFKLWQICFGEIAGEEDDWRSKLDGGNEVLSKIVDQLVVANFSSNLGIRIRREKSAPPINSISKGSGIGI